jgi:hypothetical protein
MAMDESLFFDCEFNDAQYGVPHKKLLTGLVLKAAFPF